MAIVVDTTSGKQVTASTSLTQAHTVSGLHRLLVVMIAAGASDIVTGVTYNGVAMTRVPGGFVNNGNSSAYMYYLLAPDIGTHDIVISTSASATITMDAASFTGVNQTGQPTVHVTSTASGVANCANTLTTLDDNSIHLVGFTVDTFGVSSVTNGTFIGLLGAYSNPLLITPAGSHTMTGNAGGNNAWATVGASFSPFITSPSSSVSPSLSPSASLSPSSSISASISPSASLSPSASFSPSSSQSPSPSSSGSASLSPSASPSEGFEDYSRESAISLPLTNADLTTFYTHQDVIDVSTYNGIRVEQAGTGDYIIHQFKKLISASSGTILFKGQSTLAPSASPVYLQIYNQVTSLWETIDTNNSANLETDFTLQADIADFTNYKDFQAIITCRVWQLAL